MNEILEQLLENNMPEQEEDRDSLAMLGIKPTGQALLLFAILKKGCKGDVSAAKLILELAGKNVKSEESVDLSGMSDAVLLSMLKLMEKGE